VANEPLVHPPTATRAGEKLLGAPVMVTVPLTVPVGDVDARFICPRSLATAAFIGTRKVANMITALHPATNKAIGRLERRVVRRCSCDRSAKSRIGSSLYRRNSVRAQTLTAALAWRLVCVPMTLAQIVGMNPGRSSAKSSCCTGVAAGKTVTLIPEPVEPEEKAGVTELVPTEPPATASDRLSISARCERPYHRGSERMDDGG
jgi:hypothetical protein